VPFTVSHIAAVIPGYRWFSRAQVFSAAVIGSMVPDFELLLPRDVGPPRWETHSKLGLFTFCLPVGLLTYLLTQWLIRPALMEVLPDRAYARLRGASASASASLRRAPSWILVVGALLFGAITHLVWDDITHENGVHVVSMLGYNGPDFFGHSTQLHAWSQVGSSILGLSIVLVALALWLYHTPHPIGPLNRRLSVRERALWIILYCMPPLLLGSWVVWRVHSWHMSVTLNWAVAAVAIYCVRGAAMSLLLISALMRLRLSRT
jgi:Domain of unknown function (DUF4184)